MKSLTRYTLTISFFILAASLNAAVLGTVFTYQGELNEGLNPAVGTYDFKFNLYDAAENGASVATAITNTAVTVSNGRFAVWLDFGSSPFNVGQARWLQIEVRTNGVTAFAALSPRQPLTATPYALYAPNAGTAATANRVTAGAITSTSLADSAVTSAKILDGAVSLGDLADNSVSAAKLANDATSLAKVTGGTMSTASGTVVLSAREHLNDFDLHFRSDLNHGLGWYGSGKLFGGINVNGPALYGNSGGVLGIRSGGTDTSVLAWNSTGVGIGTANPGAKLHVAGQILIAGGNPGAGKLLVSDTDGLASWQSPSALSVFFGQDYSELLPDVINNTVSLEVSGVMTADNVVMVNGPGLQIERILGYSGTNHHDSPGPNMEFPLVFEYNGSFTNALQTWYFQNQTGSVLRSMSIIVNNLGGVEQARWNLYEMALKQVDPGANGRKRYTLRHALSPDNHFYYERDPVTFPTTSSKNPATDGPRVEFAGIQIGPYPAVALDTTNRTITLTLDYTEAGQMYQWVRDTAAGTGGKRVMSIIQEVNGAEVSRRNYYEVFPIWYQQTTGFGQVEKLKEKVILSYDFDENG